MEDYEDSWDIEDEEDWGFEDPRPILKHVCGSKCNTGFYHEIEEVFDDFELSQHSRKQMHLHLPYIRGHEVRERLTIRRCISTRTGAYVLRLELPDLPWLERFVGDIYFETIDEQIEYFDYLVRLFRFQSLAPTEDTWDIDD